ncbi:NifU family protein [Jatrophihabitans sp.]|uniref:NifU family protein n=1 Tax=Jatrophihabitans sp. TaxID=1932789 RepID=UPI002F09320A
MAAPAGQGPGGPGDPDWRAAGERIDTLLDASSAGGILARERAEELVRLVADLYGAGLERVLEIMHERGHLDDDTLDALAEDDRVASLLLVHGLHPYGVLQRIEQALESVRPYLGSHGGDVELIEVTDDGVVRLRLLGSCDGCPSSSVTLKLAVEGAIEAAAPEISTIEVQTPTAVSAGPVIPMSSLFSRVSASPGDTGGSSWQSVPELLALASGSVAQVRAGQVAVLACRVGTDLFAFRDRCARCGEPMAGATVARRLGGGAEDAVLTCARCRAHYDVRRAGACLDDQALHLEPLPLLADGVSVSVAVPAAVSA